MEIKGTIIQVLPIETGNGKKGTWAKQPFILQTEGQYPKKLHISLWGQEKIDKYDIEVGLKLNAFIELESREYNNRYYTEVRAWKLEWKESDRKWQPGEGSTQPSSTESLGKSEYSTSDDIPF